MHIKRGFTLIELLVVIAIIAILATLVLVQVESALVRSRNASAQSDISEMGKTVEVYKTDTNTDVALIQNLTVTTNLTLGGTGGTANAVVPKYNLYGPAVSGTSQCYGTAVNTGCVAANSFFSGTELAGSTYGTAITKTPSTSYVYGYITSATGSDYCVATDAVNASGVSSAVGFIINDGSSVQSSTPEPVYATTGKCS